MDFIQNTVRIPKVITMASEKPEVLKTKSSRRIINLLPPAMEAIQNQKTIQLFKK